MTEQQNNNKEWSRLSGNVSDSYLIILLSLCLALQLIHDKDLIKSTVLLCPGLEHRGWPQLPSVSCLCSEG